MSLSRTMRQLRNRAAAALPSFITGQIMPRHVPNLLQQGNNIIRLTLVQEENAKPGIILWAVHNPTEFIQNVRSILQKSADQYGIKFDIDDKYLHDIQVSVTEALENHNFLDVVWHWDMSRARSQNIISWHLNVDDSQQITGLPLPPLPDPRLPSRRMTDALSHRAMVNWHNVDWTKKTVRLSFTYDLKMPPIIVGWIADDPSEIVLDLIKIYESLAGDTVPAEFVQMTADKLGPEFTEKFIGNNFMDVTWLLDLGNDDTKEMEWHVQAYPHNVTDGKLPLIHKISKVERDVEKGE